MSDLPGAVVWLGLAVMLAAWLFAGATRHVRGVPTVVDLVHWLLESWAGRLALLASWAVVGVHVLTQRP